MSVPYSYSIYNAEDYVNPVKLVKGIISFADEEVLFEFKVYTMSGNSISSLNKFSINLNQIKRVAYQNDFFRKKLIIESRRMAFLEPLPGNNQGRIALNIDRKNKKEAISFSTKMNLYLSQLHSDSDN